VKWLDPARKPFVAAVILGAVFALAFGLAYPPFNVWGLVLLAPIPLIVIAQRTKGSWRSALGVALAAAPMWWWHHDWIGEITGAGMPALVVYLCMYTGLFILIAARIARRWPKVPPVFWAPIAWTTVELLRGEIVMHGYSWFMLGEPLLKDCGPIGIYLTGFVAAMVSGGLVTAGLEFTAAPQELKRPMRFREMVPGALVAIIGLGVLFALRLINASGASGSEVRIGIVQTNIPQSNKVNWTLEDQVDDLARFLAMTREVAAMDPPPDIIVWPETMFPGPYPGNTLAPEAITAMREANLKYGSMNLPVTSFHDKLFATQKEIGIPMIVGALGVDGMQIDVLPSGGASVDKSAIYNSAFVIVDGAAQEHRYDKMFLTPFGEVMPYISAWPWLEQKLLALGANGLSFNLEAGTNQKPLEVPLRDGRTIRIAPQICFEATMPSPVRRLVFGDGWFGAKRRADMILQITNDGWIGDFTPGKEHHELLVRWRAAELNTPVVRVANTGISASIDARGNDITGVSIAARNQREWTRVFTVELADPNSVTLFARGAWMVAWLAIPVCVFMLFWPRPRAGGSTEPPSPPERPIVHDAPSGTPIRLGQGR